MTYAQAKKLATKKNPNVLYAGEHEDGRSFEVYYCTTRNRTIWTFITANNVRVV